MAKVIASPPVNTGRYRTLQRVTTDHTTDSEKSGALNQPSTDTSVSRDEYERLRNDLQAQVDHERRRANAAEEALRQHQAEMDEHRSIAQQEGLDVGRQQAFAEVQNDARAVIERLESVLQSLTTQHRTVLAEEAERVAVEIGFHAAAKIVGLSATDPHLVGSIVKNAMAAMADTNRLIVKLSPVDYEALTKPESKDLLGDSFGLELRPDSSLQYGGCVIESAAGSLDARLDLQLEAIKQALLSAHSANQVKG